MNKTPFVTKEQLDEIVKTYPTPFHLYDENGNSRECKGSSRRHFHGMKDIRNILR